MEEGHDAEYDQVSSEIRLYTSLLSGTKIDKPTTSSRKKPGSTPAQGSIKPFSHLANLLNINKKAVVAITGSVDRQGVKAAIVFSSHSKSCNERVPFERIDLTANDTITANNIIESQMVTNPPDLEQHARDLLAVFKLAKDPSTGDYEAYVIEWILHRCWPRLKNRLEKSLTQWTKDLTTSLETWQPGPNDTFSYELDFADNLTSLLSLVKIYPAVEGTRRFVLNRDTTPCCKWVRFICSIHSLRTL